ncbi:hypothetical protein [Planctomicrobium piriforme]|uniref:Ser-Thr-rich glycosyl-phosphatidyl-inositol-anchored membrane family protein n=1 Tax=Planctomicrobium piriforme TaxID=1576369 RepID=A0A1I3FRY9_9PLAN|nr:hypothetical protein [Planctomicrobium piriforme]SFI13976.1 hypothetical protein SAMN05421753_1061 [Planctomicrobium piriforme]
MLLSLHNWFPQRRFLRAGAALGLCFFACWESASAELIYSKSRRFRIPFQFDAAELKRLGAKEVQLFVSRDGTRWQPFESVPPATSKFTFEAPEDGAYWFSVKTVAASGLEYPAGPHQASLNVLVDTTVPQLELTLEENEPGRVRLAWSAHDDHVDLTTLQLEFMEPGGTDWLPVAIRSQERGQTTWTTDHAGIMQVRGKVSDLAGNTIDATVQTNVAHRPNRANERPDAGKPVAQQPEKMNTVEVNAAVKSQPLVPQLTSATSGPVPIVTTASTPLANAIDTAVPPVETVAPAGKLGHYVNSLMFRIAYNLDGIGPSGVGHVDLYITEDGGKKWYHYGHDPDRSSPVEVNVPHDGEFGFAFRVTNGLGRVTSPPQPGETPEVTVTVDRIPPIAKLHPVQPASELDQNQVLISWTAQDRDLGEKPVALFCSTAATGPWEPVQGWQPNTGKFVWTVPPMLNAPFYVRLDVRDVAGNITRVYGDTPFLIDRAQPRARVTDVESLTSSPQ